ncbi:MAG: anaerobic ribonucleoside-triphosphate reductase activating protein [Bacillota bacterium]|nr:anaerobic ribonucleoside-triphosphate reductase activating protein [Bacillota bacterium]
MKMQIAGVVNESVVDGPGIRMVIFTQGCTHNCAGCHNPETHDPTGGETRDSAELIELLRSKRLIAGVTLSGGEPLLQAAGCAEIAEAAQALGKNVLLYSGYTYEQILELAAADEAVRRLIAATDILIDGPFILEQRNIDLTFRGSENQRIIDVARSMAEKRVVCKKFGREQYAQNNL